MTGGGKHLGLAALRKTSGIVAGQLLRGQTNFLRMIWKFKQVYNPRRQYGDHLKAVSYRMQPPGKAVSRIKSSDLYIHAPLKAAGAASRPRISTPASN